MSSKNPHGSCVTECGRWGRQTEREKVDSRTFSMFQRILVTFDKLRCATDLAAQTRASLAGLQVNMRRERRTPNSQCSTGFGSIWDFAMCNKIRCSYPPIRSSAPRGKLILIAPRDLVTFGEMWCATKCPAHARDSRVSLRERRDILHRSRGFGTFEKVRCIVERSAHATNSLSALEVEIERPYVPHCSWELGTFWEYTTCNKTCLSHPWLVALRKAERKTNNLNVPEDLVHFENAIRPKDWSSQCSRGFGYILKRCDVQQIRKTEILNVPEDLVHSENIRRATKFVAGCDSLNGTERKRESFSHLKCLLSSRFGSGTFLNSDTEVSGVRRVSKTALICKLHCLIVSFGNARSILSWLLGFGDLYTVQTSIGPEPALPPPYHVHITSSTSRLTSSWSTTTPSLPAPLLPLQFPWWSARGIGSLPRASCAVPLGEADGRRSTANWLTKICQLHWEFQCPTWKARRRR